MNAVDPVWIGMRRLGSLPGLDRRVIVHAGPAHDSFQTIPVAVRNSLATVMLREGWATGEAAALALLAAGQIAIEPAQDHGIFIPLAGAAGPSAQLIAVEDRATGRAAYSPLNEGMVLCTRLGILHPDLPRHLRWLDETLAPWIAERLAGGAIPLFALLRAAIAREDDCHSRTLAGSELMVAALLQRGAADESVTEFLTAAPAFALNVWMAMCGLVAGAAEGVRGATLVTHAGGNGVKFGFRLAGDPGRWHTSPAPAIRGDSDPRLSDAAPLPALGDSAIVDVMGLGGQILASATPVHKALAACLPPDTLTLPARFLHGPLDGFGSLAATDAVRVQATGTGPLILLGMIDGTGRHGRVGGGCVATTAVHFTTGG
ncbi:DUF1116 domain-containing protein [Rhodobacter sp.]